MFFSLKNQNSFLKISFLLLKGATCVAEKLAIQGTSIFSAKVASDCFSKWKKGQGWQLESHLFDVGFSVCILSFFVILFYWDVLVFVSLFSLHQDLLLCKNNFTKINYFLLLIRWKCITESASTKTSDNLCGNTFYLKLHWKNLNRAFTSSRTFKTHAAQVIIDCIW